MTVVNPFSDDPDRGPAWESGYEAGYAEPEVDHVEPLEPELLDIYSQGERQGRDDRRQEAAEAPALPDRPSAEFSRFESAPDGTLIPIPDEAPEGEPIRSEAQVTVNQMTSAGYYVTIFNGSDEEKQSLAEELLKHGMTEASITKLEHMLAEAAFSGSKRVLKYGGIAIGVIISMLTPSNTILKETRFRGYLPDRTPVLYVVLTPQG